MANTIYLEVSRYSPEKDAAPHFETFEVPFREDWVVLDALNYIKDKKDGSLTYRWSCRMGICGSCGMLVNGEPKLTCATFLADYAPAPVRVEPLRNFPVVRDLVIAMTDFMRKLQRMKPWLIRKEEKPLSEGEYLQSPEQLDIYKQYSMCINCMLCYAACPVYGLDPLFAGPAAIALAQRYNLDSRDQGAKDRFPVLSQYDAIWGCTFVGECTRVCPKHVDPAGAIQQYKLTAALDWVKSVVMREISSVFVAIFVVEMLLQIYALSLGSEAYADFQSLLTNPIVIAINVVSFLFVVFHSITWFNLSARAMAIRVGGKRVPGFLISGPNFAAWLVISAVIAWLLLRG